MKKLKILLTDLSTLDHTFGAQALTFPMVEKLKNQADCTIVLAPSYFEKNVKFAKNNGLKIIAEPNPVGALAKHSFFFKFINFFRIFLMVLKGKKKILENEKKNQKIWDKALAEADVVIDNNGIEFIGNTNKKWPQLWRTAFIQLICEQVKKLYLKTTKSYGPFEGFWFKMAVKRLLKNLPVIFVREGTSKTSNLKQIEGLKLRKTIYEFPDISLGLKPASRAWAEAYVKKMGLDLTKPIIGLSPSAVIYRLPNKNLGGDNHLKFCQTLIKQFATKNQVLVIPHARADGIDPKKCDVALAKMIISGLETPKNLFLLDDESLNYAQVRAIIGLLNFYIGSRFHGIASSLSMAVPIISLSWHVKYQDIMSLYLEKYPIINSRELTPAQGIKIVNQYYNDQKWFNKIKVQTRQKAIEAKLDENIKLMIKGLN